MNRVRKKPSVFKKRFQLSIFENIVNFWSCYWFLMMNHAVQKTTFRKLVKTGIKIFLIHLLKEPHTI